LSNLFALGDIGRLAVKIRFLDDRSGEVGLIQVVVCFKISILQPQALFQAATVGIGFNPDGYDTGGEEGIPDCQAIFESKVQFPGLHANIGDSERQDA